MCDNIRKLSRFPFLEEKANEPSVENRLYNRHLGDAYMVASGVPEKMKTDHVREIASIALLQREVNKKSSRFTARMVGGSVSYSGFGKTKKN